jgi:hypothetical protein
LKKYISVIKCNSLEILTSILGAISLFWATLFEGRLVGDLLDARFTVVVNDHWYQTFVGNQTFTNLNFYFPSGNQLGYSDAFFTTGIVSIPFRLFGATAIQSWIFSNFLVVIVCLYFACKFFGNVLRNRTFAALLTLLIVSSYPFIAQMGHLQTVGYLLAFPLVFYLSRAYQDPSRIAVNTIISILLFQIIALTSWYAFVFTCAIVAIIAGLSVLFIGVKESEGKISYILVSLRKNIVEISNFKKTMMIISVVPLPLLWTIIYFVGFGKVTDKTYGEFVFYAPRWGDLFNSVNQSWGFQKYFNDLTQQTIVGSFERALGVTPILFIIGVIIVITLISPSSTLSAGDRKIVSVLVSASVLPGLILVTDEAGHSLWRLIWAYIEPLRSIRVPFRISVFTTWILLFAMFFVLSRLKVRKTYIIAIFVLIMVDTWRPVPSTWSHSEELSPSSRIVMNSLTEHNCSYFFLNPSLSNVAPWITQVEAMTIANITGIPTVNGYSGNWPDGWPIQEYWGRATELEIKLWVNKSTKSEDLVGCFIEQDYPFKVKIL